MAATDDKPAGMTKVNAQQKAATTHDAAMRIIDAEVAAREKKTERLRRQRLEREAGEPAVEAVPKRRRRKSE